MLDCDFISSKKGGLASNGSLLADSAKFDNKKAWLESQVCSLWLQKHFNRFSFGVRVLPEMKIWCVRDI